MNTADQINQWLVSRHDVASDAALLRLLEQSQTSRNEETKGWGSISSIGGGLLYLDRPLDSHINHFDIALALSRVARWGGRTTPDAGLYTVAQHSVMVSRLCRPEHALIGLLHDATEAYLGDIPSPLKKRLAMLYKPLEIAWSEAIALRLGLVDLGFSIECLHTLPADVKCADKIAMEVEHHDLITRGERWSEWGSIERPTLLPKIEPLDELDSFALFMYRFHELTHSISNQPSDEAMIEELGVVGG